MQDLSAQERERNEFERSVAYAIMRAQNELRAVRESIPNENNSLTLLELLSAVSEAKEELKAIGFETSSRLAELSRNEQNEERYA